jgi:hypothetical protein
MTKNKSFGNKKLYFPECKKLYIKNCSPYFLTTNVSNIHFPKLETIYAYKNDCFADWQVPQNLAKYYKWSIDNYDEIPDYKFVKYEDHVFIKIEKLETFRFGK